MIKNHPFFQTIDAANAMLKEHRAWGIGSSKDRRGFFNAIKNAHPFVFDKKVTREKYMDGRSCADVEDLVGEFSIPYGTSLYLLTEPITLQAPLSEGVTEKGLMETHGYLIHEVTAPYEFIVWQVYTTEARGKKYPAISQFRIDLRTIQTAFAHSKALDFEIFNAKTEAHVLKETSVIFHFTNAISVKRIGIEQRRSPLSLKSKGIGVGVTVVKCDSLIHIADKEEYLFTPPLDDASINWDYVGFWRGHWRAFYVDGIKDSFGRNVVDYNRTGKNREGAYTVAGYTWVSEHIKGDRRLAEIKTHLVKHGS